MRMILSGGWIVVALIGTVSPIAFGLQPRAGSPNASPYVQPIEAYGMIAPVSLATYPPVQKEISITEEQLAKVKLLRAEAANDFDRLISELYKGDPKDRQGKEAELKAKHIEALQKITDQYRPKLAEVLDAKQVKRIDQIAIQAIGEQAYSYPAVVQALKLSNEQQDKVAAIHQEFQDQMKKMGGLGGAGGNLSGRMAKAMELQADRLEKLEAVLTPEQKEQFDDMKGEPFEARSLYRSGPAR